MKISEIHYQSVETTYKNILGLKISDDILAVILITLFVFIVGGMGRWLYVELYGPLIFIYILANIYFIALFTITTA